MRNIVPAGLVLGCLLSGCSNGAPSYPAPGSTPPSIASPNAATAMRGGELGPLTARGLIDALNKRGFLVSNPHDTTAYECATAGCDQSIVTDTLRVKSFSTTADAMIYAADHGLDQVETIVVAFAPPVTKAEHDRYWAQIQQLVG